MKVRAADLTAASLDYCELKLGKAQILRDTE